MSEEKKGGWDTSWSDLALCFLLTMAALAGWQYRAEIAHRFLDDQRPAIGRPGADGSGATGRVGDDLTWEIYAERPELGRVPVTVWVHGPGWAVRCEVRPPGTGTRCVEMAEPARVEGSRR